MKNVIQENLEQICEIIEKTVDVERIYLFGSYAYGVPTADSDYDLCIIIPNNTIRPADAIKQIRRALYPIQTAPLDILVYRSDMFNQKQRGPSLERKIKREGVVLYERKEFEQRMA